MGFHLFRFNLSEENVGINTFGSSSLIYLVTIRNNRWHRKAPDNVEAHSRYRDEEAAHESEYDAWGGDYMLPWFQRVLQFLGCTWCLENW